MRNAIICIFLFINFSLSGATYYVSTDGIDSNPGTLSQPWATWHYGFNHILPGDILYIRGGTYYANSTTSHSRYCGVVVDGKNGSSASMYQVFAYPGEKPILDCRNITGTGYEKIGVMLYNSDYWHIKGLEITRVDQPSSGGTGGQGLYIQDGNFNKIELVVCHHNGGPGLGLRYACEGNLFLNCDSYLNFDAYSGLPGDHADGFDVGDVTVRTGNERENTLNGCRAWSNGDDGYDLYQHPGYNGVYYLINCWAWKNGYRPDGVTAGGNGCGFKYGDTYEPIDDVVRRYSYNCLAFDNRTRGYSQESAVVKMELYNNIAYKNGLQGYSFMENLPDILRNNISYRNGSTDIFSSNQIRDHNSWNGKVSLSDADFISLDGTELQRPRKSDGTLPDINFLHLASNSDLVDAGVSVGIAYSGIAPDMGPFEILIVALPEYLTSVIENATPSIVVLSYSLPLNDQNVPASEYFKVTVNSQPATITSVSISGDKVSLNLALPVKFNDVVNVSYTKPTTNALQTPAGYEAQGISSEIVTNNCKDPTKPNDIPIVLVDNDPDSFAGFTGTIDASETFDPNGDFLVYSWTFPSDISVSSTNNSKIEFLSPIVNSPRVIEFKLDVSDGTSLVSKIIPVNILPYKPEMDESRIKKIDASNYEASDYPQYVTDGNLQTQWSVVGDNNWLFLQMAEPFMVSHLRLAFLKGQKFSSYFDIYASSDNIIWEPILIKTSSCDFSGDFQVFDFPLSFNDKEFNYIKFIGHGNTLDFINNISEFKIFGTLQDIPGYGNAEDSKIFIYPNPAYDLFNISIEEPSIKPDSVRLIDFSGKIVFEDSIESSIKNIQIPNYVSSGIYIVELRSGLITLYAQKLLVNR